jgi:signal transduction histidine kinase
MERILTSGSDLAEFPVAMLSSAAPRAEAPTAWPSLRWPTRTELLPGVWYVGVVGLLAAIDHPAWRVCVVALTGVAHQVRYFACPRHDPRQCVNREPDELAWFILGAQSGTLVATGLVTAVTGGLHSPLLPTVLCAWFASVAVVGDRPQTRLLLAVTCAGVGALALLPAGVTGPAIGGPAFGVLSAAGVLGVGALLAPVLAIVRRKREEFVRARDDMAADALARARNLEQVGSKVAHELKNPLTGVKALVQLGVRNPAEAASRERLEVIDREVARMQEILQNYLSFTRPLLAVSPRALRLGPLVQDALVVLSARADAAQVRLYAQGDDVVEADPRRLKEALLNLVANAIEATPPGGEVAVAVRPDGEDAEIVVRDTGRGMPPETLRRIGTPFFTTRDDGTGLGVVLARSVIAQHGGTLRYESEPGAGTKVRVTLPRLATGRRDAARAGGG